MDYQSWCVCMCLSVCLSAWIMLNIRNCAQIIGSVKYCNFAILLLGIAARLFEVHAVEKKESFMPAWCTVMTSHSCLSVL